jgi:transcriptional regulator with XRE-family HTH domain
MDKDSLQSLGRRIRELRRAANLTQTDLAKKVQALLRRQWTARPTPDDDSSPPSIHHTYISRIEGGRLPHSISLPTLLAISEVLGVDLASQREMIGMAGKMPSEHVKRYGEDPTVRRFFDAGLHPSITPADRLAAAQALERKAGRRKGSEGAD